MSSAMDDMFGRRQHRPDHPDFWRISEVILANDGDMEAAKTNDEKEAAWKARTDAVVNVASVTYAGTQRTLLAFGPPSVGGLNAQQQATVAALWIDAFVTGAMYEQRGGHQEK